jgi:hypothetical protein
MAKKATAPKAEVNEVKKAIAPKAKKAKGDKTVVRFIDPNVGLTDRIYSKDVHGEDFHDKALSLAEKFNGAVNPDLINDEDDEEEVDETEADEEEEAPE